MSFRFTIIPGKKTAKNHMCPLLSDYRITKSSLIIGVHLFNLNDALGNIFPRAKNHMCPLLSDYRIT